MDCGGSDKAAHAACIAMCATAVAILSELVAVPFVVAMQDIVVDPDLPLPERRPVSRPSSSQTLNAAERRRVVSDAAPTRVEHSRSAAVAFIILCHQSAQPPFMSA